MDKIITYQKEVLRALSGRVNEFYLAGGTALSLFYFRHRLSVELRQRLFQPFSSGELRSGSGLGLTISHEIVKALGGSIKLLNRENRESGSGIQGLDCWVELPADRSAG